MFRLLGNGKSIEKQVLFAGKLTFDGFPWRVVDLPLNLRPGTKETPARFAGMAARFVWQESLRPARQADRQG